ncbi:MAG TPA: glycosyltransferase [Gammaproteobacteria bacterium]
MNAGISVIVPVFNQWNLVPSLLRCMEAQSLEKGRFELLLVDNGSDSVPPPGNEPAFVRRLSCATPGSYAARNHGVANACGELLVFTDADCRPAFDWLEKLATCIDGKELRLVAGGIKVETEEPLTAAALYDMTLALPQERYVSRGYAVTANLAMTRILFDRMNGFDAARFSGGDADFCRRAVSRGAELRYCAEAVVTHPARRSMDELIRKVRRVKGGQLRNGPFHRRFAYAIRAFLPPVRAWLRIWRAGALSGRGRLIVSLVQGRLWLTEMAETLRLAAGGSPERR